MPFRRSQPPIIRNKHELTWSNLSQNASTITNVILSLGVESANADTASEVVVGHQVRGIYLEFHFSAETITNAKVIHWSIEQLRTGQTSPNPILYYQDTRSQILKRGMEMLPKDVSTVFKRIVFVRIPKFMQRAKMNQQIVFRYVCSSTETINACGFAIYKEIS